MEITAAIAAGIMSAWFGWSALTDSAYSGISSEKEGAANTLSERDAYRDVSRATLRSSIIKLIVCWALAVTAGVLAS